MINATALYYKYSKALYTNSRIMYIGKFKNPTRKSRENKKRMLRITVNSKFNVAHQSGQKSSGEY